MFATDNRQRISPIISLKKEDFLGSPLLKGAGGIDPTLELVLIAGFLWGSPEGYPTEVILKLPLAYSLFPIPSFYLFHCKPHEIFLI